MAMYVCTYVDQSVNEEATRSELQVCSYRTWFKVRIVCNTKC